MIKKKEIEPIFTDVANGSVEYNIEVLEHFGTEHDA